MDFLLLLYYFCTGLPLRLHAPKSSHNFFMRNGKWIHVSLFQGYIIMKLKMNSFTKLLLCPKVLQLLLALNCSLKTASFLLHPTSCSSSTANCCYYSSPVRICFQSRSTTLPSAPEKLHLLSKVR
jgi:hypothetical protein